MKWTLPLLILVSSTALAGPPPPGTDLQPLDAPLEQVPFETALAALSQRPGLGVMLISSVSCPACPAYEAELERVGGRLEDAAGTIRKVELLEVPRDFLDRYGIHGSPFLLVFRDGRPEGLFLPPNGESLSSDGWQRFVLGRLGVFERTREYLFDFGESTVASSDLTNFAARYGATDASGRVLRDSSYLACDLAGADFTGANMANVVFFGTDLTGARFDGAYLEGAVWQNTVCPDGTNSRNAGDSCLEHLTVDGIANIPATSPPLGWVPPPGMVPKLPFGGAPPVD